MEYLVDMISPLTILFTVIVVGYLIGKIKIFQISLDIAATLFVAILTGFVLSEFCPFLMDDDFNGIMNSYSKIGTSFFMSVVGLTAGSSLKPSAKKTWLCLAFGICCTCVGFLCMKMIALVDTDFDKSMLLGILCGALTSTPGLSAVTERSDVISENAAIGYGSAYLFGLLCVVAFVQGVGCFSCKQNKPTQQENEKASEIHDMKGLTVIGVCSILGELLGRISWFHYSLGRTSGILICGIVLGVLRNQYKRSKGSFSPSFHMYRNLGLALFFVGNGIPAGYSLHNGIDLKCFLYGVTITTVSIATMAMLCRVFFKKHETSLSMHDKHTSLRCACQKRIYS